MGEILVKNAVERKSGYLYYVDGKGNVCVLGHIQRGGSPVAFDRVIASRMGYAAIKTLKRGRSNVFIGIVKGKIVYTPIETVIKYKCKTDISDEKVLIL